MSERTVYETDHAANVARLQQLAKDADEKAKDFRQIADSSPPNTIVERALSSSHYAGMRDGLLRAISVLEGRG